MTSRIEYNNPESNGAFGLPYHYELLSDRRRIRAFERAIVKVAPGKRVLESGAGSGILSLMAARAGARTVYAVEKDPRIAAFARRNIRKSGYGQIIRLIEADIREVGMADIDNEPVDVVVAENLSTWQVTEPQLSVMNHINRHLALDSAIRIPECVYNSVELVCSRYNFDDLVEVRSHYFGFTGVPKPLVLSRPAVFITVHFGAVNSTIVEDGLRLPATESGVVNGLRLTSPLKIFHGISFKSSDSLMPPVIVPLPGDLTVSEGETVEVRFRYHCETDWLHFECAASSIGGENSTHLGASPDRFVRFGIYPSTKPTTDEIRTHYSALELLGAGLH